MERRRHLVRTGCGLLGSVLLLGSAGSAGSAGAAGAVDLARTGQTLSYATGDDGDLEAGAEWPIPRFTSNGDGTFTDQLTGLVWLGDANCADTVGFDPNASGDGRLSWANAASFVSAVNSGSQDITACGYTGSDSDWRGPNVVELDSLVNAGQDDQSAWLAGEGFSRVQLGSYWSSTTSPANELDAFVLLTDNGRIGTSLKTSLSWVWIVRGGANGAANPAVPANLWKPGSTGGHGVGWPSPRFVDHGNGTVTDRLTGLMWLKDTDCLGTTTQWLTALSTIADFNLGGSYGCTEYNDGRYDDWRLPNRRERLSLADSSTDRPSLPPGHPFVDVAPFRAYQGSTTVAGDTGSYWQLGIYIFGNIQPQPKTSGTAGIWPVRTPVAQVPALSGRWQVALVAALAGAAALALARRPRGRPAPQPGPYDDSGRDRK